jgi:hypothetical protein
MCPSFNLTCCAELFYTIEHTGIVKKKINTEYLIGLRHKQGVENKHQAVSQGGY